MDKRREWRERYVRGLEQGLDAVADRILDASSRIIEREAIDEGTLLRSGEIRHTEPLVREIAFTAKHAVFEEYGTRPHWPPLEPILKWVKRNAQLAQDEVQFKPRVPGRSLSDAVALRIARAVQAKIAREGTKAVAYARRGAATAQREAGAIMARAVQNSLGASS